MKLENTSKKVNESNRAYVFRVLKDNIMNLYLTPGTPISESEISELLNVSRTPIREAIVKLGELDLLVVYPQKGSFVSKINLALVEEAIFMRRALEREALRKLAGTKICNNLIKDLEKNLYYQRGVILFGEDLHKFFDLDNEFHRLIFKEADLERVWQSIKQVSTHHDRLRLLVALNQVSINKTIKQHERFIKLLCKENTDPEEDVKLVEEHLSNFKESIVSLKEQHSEYFD